MPHTLQIFTQFLVVVDFPVVTNDIPVVVVDHGLGRTIGLSEKKVSLHHLISHQVPGIYQNADSYPAFVVLRGRSQIS